MTGQKGRAILEVSPAIDTEILRAIGTRSSSPQADFSVSALVIVVAIRRMNIKGYLSCNAEEPHGSGIATFFL